MLVKRVYNYLYKAKELIGLVVFYVAFLSEPFSPKVDIEYFFNDSFFDQSGVQPSKYEVMTLKVQNLTDVEIENVELEIFGIVETISLGYMVTSKRFVEDIGKELIASKINGDGIYIKNLDRIPANSSVRVQVRGKFKKIYFDERVVFNSSAGENVSISSYGRVSEAWVLISRWAYIPFSGFFVFSVFVFLSRVDKKGEEV